MLIEMNRADVTQEKSLTDAFGKATKVLGTIDGCVTAAGISLDKPFEDQNWEEVARVQDINVNSQLQALHRQ
jgi:sorbose reductase